METTRKLAMSGQISQARAARSTAAIVLLLGGVALLPRVLGLVDFLTTDEVYNWISRVERFSGAVANRQWAATVLVGHPGVTLCWLASLGLAAGRYAVEHGWATIDSQVEYLRWMRLPMATLEALAVPGAYLLLRRLVAPATALIAALLWALSPFLVAHARLLHLDALLTTFVTYSLLCALIGLRGERSLRWVAASGVCAGLALLTKGPALILLPFTGLLMIADCGLQIADWRRPKSAIKNLQSAILRYLVWLAAAALTFTLLWPAMWVDPAHPLRAFFGLIVQNGGRPNGDGQFFLGRAIGDPGPLFYVVSNLFRMTPVMLIGLLAAPLALWPGTAEPRTKNQEPGIRKQVLGSRFSVLSYRIGRWSDEQRALLALAAFALFWTLVMTLGPKKFDRYTLPTWPALLVLSAAGWKFLLWDGPAWLSRRWRGGGDRPATEAATPRGYPEPAAGRPPAWTEEAASSTQVDGRRDAQPARFQSPAQQWNGLRGALLALVLGIELIGLVGFHPYYLSYYNPLLGGGPAAQRALLIGWGEGMDQAGAYLSARPDIGEGQVLSALPRTLRPFVPVPVEDVTEFDRTIANYAVVYLESIQRGASPEIYAAIRQTVPLHRVTIHGIDYAEIYQLPKPFERPIDARFGSELVLRGVTLERAPGQLIVTPSWDVRGRPGGDYQVFVHVIDAAGRTVAQVDVAPGGGDAPPTSAWQPGQQIAVPLPLALPDGLPAGAYQVTLGMYDPQTGQRLPFSGGTPADPAHAGPNALLLDTIALP